MKSEVNYNEKLPFDNKIREPVKLNFIFENKNLYKKIHFGLTTCHFCCEEKKQKIISSFNFPSSIKGKKLNLHFLVFSSVKLISLSDTLLFAYCSRENCRVDTPYVKTYATLGYL